MSASAQLVLDRREDLRGPVIASLVLHGALLGLALGYAARGFRRGPGWGNPWNGNAARVGVVTSLPGMPLPSPMLATPNTVATENPSLYHALPKPKEEPAPEAQEIPKFKEEFKPAKPLRINKRIQEEMTPPPNAIPAGEGGKPSLTYGQIANGEGSGAVEFGAGFGERYGWYVEAARNRISSNWLMSAISPTVTAARRVYVHFEILRDGHIQNVRLTQSSGNAEIDRSALRAVYASDPLGPLPQDYRGDRVAVDFYFDFSRR